MSKSGLHRLFSVELTDFFVYENVLGYLASREDGKRNETGIELHSSFWRMCFMSSKGRNLLITTKIPSAERDVLLFGQLLLIWVMGYTFKSHQAFEMCSPLHFRHKLRFYQLVTI